jgi:hypothetical protein
MQIQPAPPAPSTPAVLSAPAPAQIPTAQTAPTPPAAPAHPVQAAAATSPPVPLAPAPGVTASEKAPRPATTPTVDDPLPTPIDSESETNLTAEIVKLWGDHKNGNANVRRTRAEIKSLRLVLAGKLHTMKAILVRTGRGGGWASYLRTQKLPLASADRYVAEHEAKTTEPEKKLLNEEQKEPTVDEVRQLARKMLPKVSRVLTTQELVYEFVHELVWNVDVAEAWDTEKGLEIPKIGSDDNPGGDSQVSELAGPTPAVP